MNVEIVQRVLDDKEQRLLPRLSLDASDSWSGAMEIFRYRQLVGWLRGPRGGGRWRETLREEVSTIHALAPCLEPPKLLTRRRSGRGLLFKFGDFSLASSYSPGPLSIMIERQAQRLAYLADAGFTIAPLASVHGWLVLPWLEGRRLRAEGLDEPLLRHIGKYIAKSAAPPLNPTESEEARERLRRILLCNSRELLSKEAEECAARAAEAEARWSADAELPGYGDGRLAPHEWMQTETGLVKIDAAGHEQDHTAVGRQPVWWDIAGATVEWDLDDEGAGILARMAGVADHAAIAAYYRSAYAALRAGIADLCMNSCPPGMPESRQFASALVFYRTRLQRELSRLNCLVP